MPRGYRGCIIHAIGSGVFQQRLPNKEKIVSAWTEIRSGMK
jgi:hypothetical protein